MISNPSLFACASSKTNPAPMVRYPDIIVAVESRIRPSVNGLELLIYSGAVHRQRQPFTLRLRCYLSGMVYGTVLLHALDDLGISSLSKLRATSTV